MNYFYVEINFDKENSTKTFNGKIEAGEIFDMFLFNCINIYGKVTISPAFFQVQKFNFWFNNEKDFKKITEWIKKYGEVL